MVHLAHGGYLHSVSHHLATFVEQQLEMRGERTGNFK
jgi:hypothetical protein